MAHVEVRVRKWGNSLGIIIPKEVAEELEISESDLVDASIAKKKKTSGFGLCRGTSPFVEEEETHPELA